jgi:hypothetical protein
MPLKKLGADCGHALLDARRDRRGRIQRVLQEVLQVPADVFLILRAQSERKPGTSGPARLPLSLERDLDAVFELREPQGGHGSILHIGGRALSIGFFRRPAAAPA